jgi:glycogen debranching enzyme
LWTPTARGRDFGIGVDPDDGLLRSGSPLDPVTWMDAKRDGVVFTPRNGKAVEIQRALVLVADVACGGDRAGPAEHRA